MKIDINCDLGEGLNNEEVLMPFLSSCNIACTAHAGSLEIIDEVIGLALKNDVKIGAHPSFPDRENFGRVVMKISNDELSQSLCKQLQLFKNRANQQKASIHHVKAHGALYNLIAADEEKAKVVVNSIQNVFGNVKIYAPFHSKVEKVAKEQKMEVVYEAFADRNYNNNLTLVSRKEPNALLTDPKEIISHVARMVKKSQVKTVFGEVKTIKAETFCVHGDHPNVLQILKELNQYFH